MNSYFEEYPRHMYKSMKYMHIMYIYYYYIIYMVCIHIYQAIPHPPTPTTAWNNSSKSNEQNESKPTHKDTLQNVTPGEQSIHLTQASHRSTTHNMSYAVCGVEC